MYLLNKDMPKHTSTSYDLIYCLFKCIGTVLGSSFCTFTFVSYYCLIFLQLWAPWMFKWTFFFLMVFSLSVLFVGGTFIRVLQFSVSVWIHPGLECKQFIWEMIPDRRMKKGGSQESYCGVQLWPSVTGDFWDTCGTHLWVILMEGQGSWDICTYPAVVEGSFLGH